MHQQVLVGLVHEQILVRYTFCNEPDNCLAGDLFDKLVQNYRMIRPLCCPFGYLFGPIGMNFDISQHTANIVMAVPMASIMIGMNGTIKIIVVHLVAFQG